MRWLTLLLLLIASPIFAQSSVWRVSHGERSLVIGGTFHMLAAEDYPLPAEFDRAYEGADHLVLETDLATVKGVAFQARVVQRLAYGDGGSLKTDLGPEAYAALHKYCAARGIPMMVVDRLRPPLAVMTLVVLEMQRMGLTLEGVDEVYYQRAQADGKPGGQLESADQQLEYIANMGRGHEDELVMKTLGEMQDLAPLLAEMKSAWRSGDRTRLTAVALTPFRRDYPELYHTLVKARNDAWVPQIEALLSTAERELVLVGSLHLVGQDGVLQQLQRRGYEVEPY